MMMRKQFMQTAFLAAAAALVGNAGAQDKFPSKPIRMIVGFGAGGSGDLLARALAQQMSEVLGQQVLVENRPGASAIPATEYAAKQPADGYTIMQYNTTLAVNMILQPSVPYDLFHDFAPIAYTFSAPLVLLTPGTSPNRKISELLAYAKSGKSLSFGHGGTGSMSHLSGELFTRTFGIDAVSIAYKGNAPAMTDLIGGRLDYYFSTVNDVLPNIKAGRLNALAITSPLRDAVLPEVPTMVELGYNDFTPVTNWGYIAPKNTPAPVVKILQDAMLKALSARAMQERLTAAGANSVGAGGGDALTAKMRAEIARWRPVIKAANIKPE